MAMRVETNPPEAAHAVLLEDGLDGAGGALRLPVNEAARIERTAFIGARPYGRTETRRDYAHGFKPQTMLTRFGEATFRVPQVRSGDWCPSAPKKATRTDQAVNLAPAAMVCPGRVHPPRHRRAAAPHGAGNPDPFRPGAVPQTHSKRVSRPGVSVPWARGLASFSTPVTRRCVRTAESPMARS